MESAFLKIINAKVLTPSGLLPNGQIIISDGKIVELTGQNRSVDQRCRPGDSSCGDHRRKRILCGSRLYRHACTRRQRT